MAQLVGRYSGLQAPSTGACRAECEVLMKVFPRLIEIYFNGKWALIEVNPHRG